MLCFHALAGTAILMAELPDVFSSMAIAAIAVSVSLCMRKRGDVILRCQTDGGLAERIGDDWQSAALMPNSMVWPGWVVLRYRLAGERQAITRSILADSIGEDDFRRLRVWLRWGAITDGS